ncbi:MAG: L-seryl-tRNA(Sec) selenium transferase [Candidatus Rariloculaceae bacterium]
MSKDLFKKLPAIDKWLASTSGQSLCAEFSHEEVADVMRAHLVRLRKALSNGGAELPEFESEEYGLRLHADLIKARTSSFRRTINATGVIIHTNLGRAPLADEAISAISETASGYSNLEFDLESGKRGSRYQHIESLLTRLTGAEAAIVVNNCAAAVLLALSTVAKGSDAVISRGELVEIGGSFRMPDVIAQSGAQMVEVGTTNKTHIDDYAAAISESSSVLLAIHPSNFRIVGFTEKPALAQLAELAQSKSALLVEDLGSGSIVDLSASGLSAEPTVQASLKAGVDLVTFSGDKLLGGPQAGIILGREELIVKIRRNPLTRALRIDKLSLAALEATLRLYAAPHDPLLKIPVLKMISEDASEVGRRADELLERLQKVAGVDGVVVDGVSYSGGGALPMDEIPTRVVQLRVENTTASQLAERLRSGDTPVIGRIADDVLHLDLRTVLDRDLPDLVAAVEQAVT